ncbi:MAG: hypothetical protein HOP96_04105 [Sphingomonas sp.]|nr:hypothetical protein [Sphingomonas sp.]
MRMMLLGLAVSAGAVALAPAPAAAQSWAGQGFAISSGSSTGGFVRPQGCSESGPCTGGGTDRRRHRRGDDGVIGTWVESGQWARYNNRSFESDSYNDWWHDQPWRAYPRWMTKNENCDRMWYSGNVLRC